MGYVTGFVDEDGQPLTLEEWARRFEDSERRVMARDQLGSRTLITMWHGIYDTTLCGARPFGTALIGGGEGAESITELETYSTKDLALIGHRTHLEALMANPGGA